MLGTDSALFISEEERVFARCGRDLGSKDEPKSKLSNSSSTANFFPSLMGAGVGVNFGFDFGFGAGAGNGAGSSTGAGDGTGSGTGSGAGSVSVSISGSGSGSSFGAGEGEGEGRGTGVGDCVCTGSVADVRMGLEGVSSGIELVAVAR
jgi:hypothetical protein